MIGEQQLQQQILSPSRTVVTSFTPRRPGNAASPFADGDWVLCLTSSTVANGSAATLSCALSNGFVQVYDQESLHQVA